MKIAEIRDHTLRGLQRVFAGPLKNFRQILMGHKIFLRIFDGPQKCSYVTSFKKL